MSHNQIEKLVETVAFLRSENGCEWDKKQNHKSMIPFIIEEMYEVVDAIEDEDFENLKEELGDLLFHIVFQAKLAEESKRFDFEEIAKTVSEKLIRRHPHVFKDKINLSPDEVLKNWQAIKKTEKTNRTSVMDNITKSSGALVRAEKMQVLASKIGFDWDQIQDVEKKLKEEIGEFLTEIQNSRSEKNHEKLEDEFGDVLFSLINIGRHCKISPEKALNKTILKFSKRFRLMEKLALEKNLNFENLSLSEKDALWEIAKRSTVNA